MKNVNLTMHTSIQAAALQLVQDGYVDYRGHLVTKSNVLQYQGKLNLTTARKHLSEIYQGK